MLRDVSTVNKQTIVKDFAGGLLDKVITQALIPNVPSDGGGVTCGSFSSCRLEGVAALGTVGAIFSLIDRAVVRTVDKRKE